MQILKNIVKKFWDLEEKSAPADVNWATPLMNLLGLSGEQLTATSASSWYRSVAAVATSVDMIAESIEQISPALRLENGDLIDDHPVLDFLRQPNPHQDYGAFCSKLAHDHLLKPEVFVLASGNTRFEPISIYAEDGKRVTVTRGMDGYPTAFNSTSSVISGIFSGELDKKFGRRYRFVDSNIKEVGLIAGYASDASGDPDSPLAAAINDIRQLFDGKRHNLSLVKNGGVPGYLITFADEISDSVHKERNARLQEQWGGPENAGKIGSITGDIKSVTRLGASNQDMDFAELQKAAELVIYRRYKIPGPLVSSEASTYNNVSESIHRLYSEAVLPESAKLFSGLSRFLLPRFGLDPRRVSITYDPMAIEPLMAARLEQLQKRRTIGTETTNELRQLLPGRDQLGPEHDVLYQNAGLVPVSSEVEEF